MPLYPYRCRACGRTDDLLTKYEARPALVACACGGEMRETVGAPAPIVVAGRTGGREGTRLEDPGRAGFVVTDETPTMRIREKGTGLTLVDWRCRNGHEHFECYDVRPEVGPACPECGEPCAAETGIPDVGWFEKMPAGGYYDRGLGVWVTSRTQRREEMEKQGVVEFGEVGDGVHDEKKQARARAIQKENDGVREMLRGWEHGPSSAAIKRDRDRRIAEDPEHADLYNWDWMHEALARQGG